METKLEGSKWGLNLCWLRIVNFQALLCPSNHAFEVIQKKSFWVNIKINSSNHANSSPGLHQDIHETTCIFNILGIDKCGWLFNILGIDKCDRLFNILGIDKCGWLFILSCNWGTRKQETTLGGLLFSAFFSPIQSIRSSQLIPIYIPPKCRTINHHFYQFSMKSRVGGHRNTKINGASLRIQKDKGISWQKEKRKGIPEARTAKALHRSHRHVISPMVNWLDPATPSYAENLNQSIKKEEIKIGVKTKIVKKNCI